MAPLHAQVNDPETIRIIKALIEWHQQLLAELTRLRDADADLSVVVHAADGSEEIDLTPQALGGFRLGVHAAIEQIKDFPLKVTEETPDSDEVEEGQ